MSGSADFLFLNLDSIMEMTTDNVIQTTSNQYQALGSSPTGAMSLFTEKIIAAITNAPSPIGKKKMALPSVSSSKTNSYPKDQTLEYGNG
jgi:hypothetical protein